MMDWNAYHFVGKTLRDGSPIPANGVALKYEGQLKLHASGLHANREAWQALDCAPGHTLCRVYCDGKVIEPSDGKLVCAGRTIISRIDAGPLLRSFARSCALDVINLWNAPQVVKDYLETGDESKRPAASGAAWAARNPVYVSRDTARVAVYAVKAAARAARSAARADRDAVYAARAAARYAVDAARSAASLGAVDAAGDAVQNKQRSRFTRMVNAEFERAAA